MNLLASTWLSSLLTGSTPPLAATLLGWDLLTLTVNLTWGIFSAAVLLAFIRLIRGPSLADRVVALDLIGTTSVGIIAVYSLATGEAVILLPAIVVALIMFLGTVAFASYLERGSER